MIIILIFMVIDSMRWGSTNERDFKISTVLAIKISF